MEALEKLQGEIANEKAAMAEELEELKERLDIEQASHQSAEGKLEGICREFEMLKVEHKAAVQNLEKAEYDKSKVRACGRLLPILYLLLW